MNLPTWLAPRWISWLFLPALLSAAAPAQTVPGQWSDQFDRPGLLGRVFALGTYQGDVVAGGLGLEGDGDSNMGLVGRFDGAHWSGLPGGPSSGSPNQVRALQEFRGELVVGGQFHSVPGQVVNDIARWDGSSWSGLDAGVEGIVWSMAVFRGDLIVGGEFTNASGVTVNSIARWDGTQWHPLGSGMPQGSVYTLLVGPNDLLYAGGEFDSAGGVTANHIAVWDGSIWAPVGSGFSLPLGSNLWDLAFFGGDLYACGSSDLVPGGGTQEKVARFSGGTWVAAGNFPDTSIHTVVYALLADPSGLYAAGNIAEVDGTPAESIARYDGSSWGFVGGVSGSAQTTTIFDLEHSASGEVIVGGEFSQAGFQFLPGQGGVVSQSIAGFDGTSWRSLGTGEGLNFQTRDATLWNGRAVLVGSFSEAGSEIVSGPVIFENGGWEPLAQVGGGRVECVTVIQGDLFLGGDFTSVDGQPIFGVARHDGTNWSGLGSGNVASDVVEYQGQIYAGGLGGVRRFNGTTWESFAPQLFGQVYDLHVHNGVLYIGGSMWGSDHLVSWDNTTQQTVAGTGTNGSVYALHSFNGDLLVGGTFTQAGGVSAHTLARWDGAAFQSFGSLTGTQVNSMATFLDELYVGGNLFVPGFPPEKYLARWDGSGWSPVGSGIEGAFGAIVPDDARGHLWVTGQIAEAGEFPSWHVARWEVDMPSLGTTFCVAAPNSAGPGARIGGTGSAAVSLNDITLEATLLPPGAPGLFFHGSSTLQVPFGDGFRCVGGSTQRLFPVDHADANGRVMHPVDVSSPPASTIVPGATRHFQFWYRDPMAGQSGFNMTDGLSVTFQ